MTIHQKIRDARKRLDMTEQQFANAVGVSRSAVHQWEVEGGTAPRRAHQPAVAKLMGISVAELMGEAGHAPAAVPHSGIPTPPDCTCPDHVDTEWALRHMCTLLTAADTGTSETALALLASLVRNPHTLDSVCKGLAAVLQPSSHTANRKAA